MPLVFVIIAICSLPIMAALFVVHVIADAVLLVSSEALKTMDKALKQIGHYADFGEWK